MASAPRLRLEELESATPAGAMASRQRDEQFMSSTSFRDPSSHACQIIPTEHDPSVPFRIIGNLFNVDRGGF
jgi:hypothetical protein